MGKRAFLLYLILGIACQSWLHAQKKDDSPKFLDANYDEQKVPHYKLPKLLVTFDGKKIRDKTSWETVRRPEILDFFGAHIYGKVPQTNDPIQSSFKVVSEDMEHLEGLCTRKDITITLSNKKGTLQMPMVIFVPNQVKKPVPTIYWLNSDDIQRKRFDLNNPQGFGKTRNGAPLKQLMLRGIALASIDAGAIAPTDSENGRYLTGGIVDLFLKEGQDDPASDEWGLLATWSYALSRGLDYLLTDADINPDQIAALGVSKFGKAAIWAAANDQRFGMVLSDHSGHGGDALWKRQFGETLANMTEWLPRWLCENSHQYATKVPELPVDQHMALALIAPRPLYVANSIHDLWADPKGQYLAAYHASPAYKLYGENVGLTSKEMPEINKPIIKSTIGYHVRTGFHGMRLYDWEQYMKFIEFHFMKIEPRTVHEIYYPNGKLVKHFPNMNSGK